MGNFDWIAIHHAAVHSSVWVSVEEAAYAIAWYHIGEILKWWAVGYCWLVHPPTLEVALCGEPDSIRAHVKDQNDKATSICILMDGRTEMLSVPARNLVQRVANHIRTLHPGTLVTVGHRDITVPGWGTNCPTDACYENGQLAVQ